MFQSDKLDNNKTSSILGPELEIHGDVIVSGSLLIYGKIFGNINRWYLLINLIEISWMIVKSINLGIKFMLLI